LKSTTVRLPRPVFNEAYWARYYFWGGRDDCYGCIREEARRARKSFFIVQTQLEQGRKKNDGVDEDVVWSVGGRLRRFMRRLKTSSMGWRKGIMRLV
jgi:hypothetical protein